MKISLKNKRALIGGSSRGLGNAVARQLAMSGAKVTIMARSKDLLQSTVEDLNKLTSVKHDFLVVDYNNWDDYKIKIENYILNNPIDILVNNTQGPKAGDVESVDIEDYQKSFDLLFKSVVHTTMLSLKNMKKMQWGRVINMASISVKEPLSYLALSNTIRSAVTTWSKTLASQIGQNGITVNNILTGYFDTERIKELNTEKSKKLSLDINNIYKEMCDLVPAKRLGKPEEFGYLIAFLSSNKASYINGINIPIDGGLLKSF